MADEFAAAVDLVAAHGELFDRFVSHTFPLTGVTDAFELLEHEPDAAYKALVDLRAGAGAARWPP